MIVLYIILGILALITVLLCHRVGIIVSYNSEKEEDAVGLTVSYLFMRIKLLPKNNRVKLSNYTYKKVQKREAKARLKAEKKAEADRLKKEQKEAEKAKKKADREAAKKAKKKKNKSKKPPQSAPAPEEKKKTNAVKLIWDIKELIFDVIKRFPHKLRLDISRLRLRIGCGDAATTAVTYGAVTEGVGALITLLECSAIKTVRGHGHDIMIVPDFISGKIDADIKIKLSIAPSAVISLGMRFIWGFIKYKISSIKNNI